MRVLWYFQIASIHKYTKFNSISDENAGWQPRCVKQLWQNRQQTTYTEYTILVTKHYLTIYVTSVSVRLKAQNLTLWRPPLPYGYRYTVWVKKIPPCGCLKIFPNGWEFLNKFLHTYYTFFSTLDYKFLLSYLQLWRSYVILSATTQPIFTFH